MEKRLVRLAHISDVHIHAPARWRLGDFFSKRITGWLNLRLTSRGDRFANAAHILSRFVEDVQARDFDAVLFSGDATALGFDEELASASSIFRVDMVPGIAVPGNHDYYTRRAAASGLFEKHFAPWLVGERIDGQSYPFARKIGPLYVIALNSSKDNLWPWDASGRVGAAQLDRLQRLLAVPHITAAPKLLLTHYPICLKDGRPEKRHHGLCDLNEVLAIAKTAGVRHWLHGHRHHRYQHETEPVPSICAGSGTERNIWTYAEYEWKDGTLQVNWRSYREDTDRFNAI